LVVIAIIGILVALLLPAIQAAREAARRNQCLNNIRQVGIALMNFESNKKQFPIGATQRYGDDPKTKAPYTGDPTMYSWVSLIMPYIEESGLYESVDWTIPLGERNAQVPPDTSHHIPFETYKCPSDEQVGITNTWYGARGNYAGNVGIGVVWMNDPSPTQDCFKKTTSQFSCAAHPYPATLQWGSNPEAKDSSLSRFGTFMVNKGRAMAEFEDGTSKTAAVAEIRTIPGVGDNHPNGDTRGVLHFGAGVMYMHDYPPNYIELRDLTRWCVQAHYAPCNGLSDYRGGWRHFARSAHPGGLNAMMVDTSARFVSDDINPDAWKALATPRGAESFDEGI
jgi:type II secretory pathway pseudopilin PulG